METADLAFSDPAVGAPFTHRYRAARGRATVSEASRTHAACVAPLSGWKTGSRGPRRQRYATAAGSVIHTLRLGGKISSCARQRFALNRLRLIAAGPTCFRACRLEIASPRPRSVCSRTDRSLPQHLSRRVVLPILSPYAHMLLFATLVIVVMKFFRAGIFGLIADRLKARGLISRAPPFTVE